jgi:hypothetical protein
MVLGFLASCQERKILSEVEDVSISKVGLGNESFHNLPFESIDVLKGFNSSPEIPDYALARKIAATGLDKEMGWEVHKPSLTPIVIQNNESEAADYYIPFCYSQQEVNRTTYCFNKKLLVASVVATKKTAGRSRTLLKKRADYFLRKAL